MTAYWGVDVYIHALFDLGTGWRWAVSFTPRPLYPQGKSPWYPSDRRLGGPQSRCGRGGEKKNSHPRRKSNPRTPIVQPVDFMIITWQTTFQMYKTCIYEGVTKSFRTKSVTKHTLTTINTRWEATQRVMAAKLTRLASQNSDTTAPSGRELYHLPFSLQAASPETFGYSLVFSLFLLYDRSVHSSSLAHPTLIPPQEWCTRNAFWSLTNDTNDFHDTWLLYHSGL
jgi:hypothetical protein